MKTNIIHISEFCIILMAGRTKAQDLAIEFSLDKRIMLMPIYRLN